MNRLVNDLPRRTALDNRAQVHDRDTIREVAGGGDVMRDVEEGDAALVLETAQQVEDLHCDEASTIETGSSATM